MIEKTLAEMEKLRGIDFCFEISCEECEKKYGCDCDVSVQI